MDFTKVFDQTVRDIKREINLRVLNVPEIEQKVLDATSDEPWGPHGSALSEMAEATKRYVECEMVMNTLWQRLNSKDSNWRHLYKALAVIEYLIANGSERAIADIYDNISQISALERYEHVEPNLKDVGLNVRRKAEVILSILDDREKLQQVREKAASTRDKYIGLSSNGMGYNKSSRNSFHDDKYKFRDSYRDDFSRETLRDNNEDISSYKNRENNEETIKNESRVVEKLNDDYDDDFDPRASSKSGNGSPTKLDLFAPNLMDDLISVPKTETDLFSDANFQSASSNSETIIQSKTEDIFANKPSENYDPFASMVLNSFDQTLRNESEFGSLNSNTESLKKSENKENSQVKSRIWADSLNSGLIDLNITSPKKRSLADQKGKSFKT